MKPCPHLINGKCGHFSSLLQGRTYLQCESVRLIRNGCQLKVVSPGAAPDEGLAGEIKQGLENTAKGA